MADMFTELDRKLHHRTAQPPVPREQYVGLFHKWDDALIVAHRKASATGRRHVVQHLSRVRPDWLRHCAGAVWCAREVGAPCS